MRTSRCCLLLLGLTASCVVEGLEAEVDASLPLVYEEEMEESRSEPVQVKRKARRRVSRKAVKKVSNKPSTLTTVGIPAGIASLLFVSLCIVGAIIWRKRQEEDEEDEEDPDKPRDKRAFYFFREPLLTHMEFEGVRKNAFVMVDQLMAGLEKTKSVESEYSAHGVRYKARVFIQDAKGNSVEEQRAALDEMKRLIGIVVCEGTVSLRSSFPHYNPDDPKFDYSNVCPTRQGEENFPIVGVEVKRFDKYPNNKNELPKVL